MRLFGEHVSERGAWSTSDRSTVGGRIGATSYGVDK